MINQNKKRIESFISILVIVVILNIAITSIIQAFKCSKMTQTELFIHIPESFVYNWVNCK